MNYVQNKKMIINSLKNNIRFVVLILLFLNTLTHSDLQQSEKDWNYAYSLGMSFSVGSGTANGGSGNGQASAGQDVSGQTGIYNTGAGSTTIGFSNSGFEKEGVAQATVGGGTITTGSDTSGLNRDETQSMLVTKNERTGGLDGNITIDNSILTDPKGYMESVISGVQKMPEFAGKATNTYNTIIGLTLGSLGYLYSHTFGDGKAKVSIGHNAVQFEGVSVIDRPFTVGNTIIYDGVGSGIKDEYGRQITNGPDTLLRDSYTNTAITAPDGSITYPTVGDHEEGHTHQYEDRGLLFLPSYVVDGMKNADKLNPPQSPLTFPGHEENTLEQKADAFAKGQKLQRLKDGNYD